MANLERYGKKGLWLAVRYYLCIYLKVPRVLTDYSHDVWHPGLEQTSWPSDYKA